MTSILSAAGYSPPKKKAQPRMSQQNNLQESASKRALRMRASKYFHRGSVNKSSGSGSGPANANATATANAMVKTGKEMESSCSNSEATAPSTITTPDTTPTPKQQTASAAAAAVHHRRPPMPNNRSSANSNSRSKSPSTAFFPRTSVLPKPQVRVVNANHNPSSNTITNTNTSSNTQHITIDIVSDIDDPELQAYPSDVEDIQSNATSGYNSGSDLENAARRILRGKGRRSPIAPIPRTVPVRGEKNDNDNDNDVESANKLRTAATSIETATYATSSVGSVASNNSIVSGLDQALNNLSNNSKILANNNNKSSSSGGKGTTLPKGWRERIERKTGRQLPKMAPSKTAKTVVETNAAVDNEDAVSEKEVSNQLEEDNVTKDDKDDVDYGQLNSSINTSISVAVSGHDESQATDNDQDQNNGQQHSQIIGSYQDDGQYEVTADGKQHHSTVVNNSDEQQRRPSPAFSSSTAPSPAFSSSTAPTDDSDAVKEYYPEDVANKGAFPTNYSRAEGGHQVHQRDGGVASAAQRQCIDNGNNGNPSTTQHGLTDGRYNYPQTNGPDRIYQNTDQPLDQLPEYGDDADAEAEDDNGPPLKTTTHEYNCEAYAEDENEDYYSQEWDPDNMNGMEDDNNEWGDPGNDFQSFAPIAQTDGAGNFVVDTFGGGYENGYVDDDRGFSPSTLNYDDGGDYRDDDNLHQRDEGAHKGFVPISTNENGFSTVTNNLNGPMQNLPPHVKRVHFSSSVEGDAGADENDSEEFDQDEYFHVLCMPADEEMVSHNNNADARWEATPLAENNNGTDTCWEAIPPSPKVQWNSPHGNGNATAPSSSKTKDDSFHEALAFHLESFESNKDQHEHAVALPPPNASDDNFNEGTEFKLETFAANNEDEEEPAWSAPKSPAPKSKEPQIDRFAWKENDHPKERVASTPQWKLRKLMAEKQTTSTNKHVAKPNNIVKEAKRSVDLTRKDLTNEETKLKPHLLAQPVNISSDKHLATQPLQPYSDGELLSDMGYDTSDLEGGTPGRRKSRRGLGFFRSRNRKYNSEGERSDSDWESSADDRIIPSFSLSPLRRSSKKKKIGFGRHGKSPRRMRLFGEKSHSYQNQTEDVDSKYRTWHQPDVPTESNSSLHAKSTHVGANIITQKTVYNIISPEPDQNTDKTPTRSDANKNPTKPEVEVTLMVDSRDGPTETQFTPIVPNTEDELPMTADTNLNESRDTQATPIVSNSKHRGKAAHTKMPPLMPSTAMTRNRGMAPMPPPDTAQFSEIHQTKIEKTVNKDSQHSGAPSGTTIQTQKVDDDTISTLGSRLDELGSLVTKSSAVRSVRRNKTDDISTVTEMSEIERLRKENDVLREELENASQLSSKVSSMYAENLKLENNRLREELENASQLPTTAGNYQNLTKAPSSPGLNSYVRNPPNPKVMIYKSTLETLLEKDNESRPKKDRQRAAAITDFNHLPPVAHLINGVDFDDDSITTYTPIANDISRVEFERDAECDVGGPEFLKKTCTRIATTTRTVAVQMKTVAEDLNNERRETGSFPIPSCFAVCTRRDKTNGSMKTEATRKKSNSTRKKSARRAVTSETSTQSSDSLVHSEGQRKSSRGTRKKRGTQVQGRVSSNGMTPVPLI